MSVSKLTLVPQLLIARENTRSVQLPKGQNLSVFTNITQPLLSLGNRLRGCACPRLFENVVATFKIGTVNEMMCDLFLQYSFLFLMWTAQSYVYGYLRFFLVKYLQVTFNSKF